MSARLTGFLHRSHLARRLAGGGAAGIGTRLGKAALSLAAAALLARGLSPSAFGVYLLGQSVALFGSAVAVLGLENTLIRQVAWHVARGEHGAVQTTLLRAYGLIALGVITVGAVLMLAHGVLLRHVFNEPKLTAMAGWLAIWVALEALCRMQVSALRGEHRLVAAAALDGFVQAAVFLAVVIWMAVAGGIDLPDVFIASSLSSGVSSALGGWLLSPFRCRTRASVTGGSVGEAASMWALWCRSWPLLGATTLGFFITRGDIWLVGIVDVSARAALYGSVLKLMIIVSLPLNVLNRTLSSTLAEFHAQRRIGELEVLLRGTTTVVAITTGVLVLALVLFGEQMLALLFGEFYATATPILIILAVARLVFAATGPCGAMLMMAGHERLQLAVSVASGVYLLLGSLWAGGQYGMMGVALVSVSNTALNNLITVLLVRWRVGVWSHAYLSPFRIREGLIQMAWLVRDYAN